jgi:hypothetical protein
MTIDSAQGGAIDILQKQMSSNALEVEELVVGGSAKFFNTTAIKHGTVKLVN